MGKVPDDQESAPGGFCACRWCPLWSGYGLQGEFYCAEGVE